MTVELLHGDCREHMRAMQPNSIDAIVCDPPYGLEFMGKEWDTLRPDILANRGGRAPGRAAQDDAKHAPVEYGRAKPRWTQRCDGCGKRDKFKKPHDCPPDTGWSRLWIGNENTEVQGAYGRSMQAWHEAWAIEAFRVLKPGGRLLAFGGTRTHHRMVCAIEDAGFVIEDEICWLYGCLSDDTEILIDGRWEPYHKATAGSRALCYNPDDDSYAWLPIQETFRYDISDTAYRIRSDSTDQLVSRNHRCLVERGGTYVFERAETLASEQEIRVPVLEGLPQLLSDLPVPERNAGHAKQGVFAGMRRRLDDAATNAQAALRTAWTRAANVLGMRRVILATAIVGQTLQGAALLQAVQRQGPRPGLGEARAQRPSGMDARGIGVGQSQNDRLGESGVEGRRHLLQDARQLHRRSLRALSDRIPGDGPHGWVRDGASAGGRADHRASVAALGSRASQGPHAGQQRSVQPATVRQQQRPQTVRASRYTRADLATVRPVAYRGVVWCVRVPTGAFVARRNGKVFVTGNSGFPKHKSKLKPAHEPVCVAWKPDSRATVLRIDACRIVTTSGPTAIINAWEHEQHLCDSCADHAANSTKLGTPGTRAFIAPSVAAPTSSERDRSTQPDTSKTGIGCSDGPSRAEPSTDLSTVSSSSTAASGNSITGRSPMDSSSITSTSTRSTTESRICNSCGALSTTPSTARTRRSADNGRAGEASADARYTERGGTDFASLPGHRGGDPAGRWPANVCLDEEAAALLDAQSGDRRASGHVNRSDTTTNAGGVQFVGGGGKGYAIPGVNTYADTGGASRFFYTAKSSRRERNAGLDGLPERAGADMASGGTRRLNDPEAKAARGRSPEPSPPQSNHHPTVKPVALMRWLVTLVTPPGGTVYDPFLGSGSTGCAAVLAGVHFVGSELSAEYLEIAERRIAHVQRHGERWLEAAGKQGVGRSTVGKYGEDRKTPARRQVQVCIDCDRRNPSGVRACQSCGGVLHWRDEQAERDNRSITDLPLFAVAD